MKTVIYEYGSMIFSFFTGMGVVTVIGSLLGGEEGLLANLVRYALGG